VGVRHDARLLRALLQVGAEDQAADLIARDPGNHAALDNPYGIAALLDMLLEVGAEDQAATLIARDPANHAALDHPNAVADLLDALRKAGAEAQVRTLVDRLPAEGMFALFCRQSDHQMRYRFGREADGSPASPWGWEDLDIPPRHLAVLGTSANLSLTCKRHRRGTHPQINQ
jgi:hypothetical protein